MMKYMFFVVLLGAVDSPVGQPPLLTVQNCRITTLNHLKTDEGEEISGLGLSCERESEKIFFGKDYDKKLPMSATSLKGKHLGDTLRCARDRNMQWACRGHT